MVKYFFKRAAMLMALAAVVIASGCKQTVNTETVNTGTTAVAVTGIALDKSVLPLKVGESKKLVATVMPANATNKQVTWASDNPAVAAVSQDGTVTATELSFCHFHRFSDQNHRETTKKSTSFFLKTS